MGKLHFIHSSFLFTFVLECLDEDPRGIVQVQRNDVSDYGDITRWEPDLHIREHLHSAPVVTTATARVLSS